MSDITAEQLAELPASAKLVITVLHHRGAQTQKQLAEESLLPTRTVRYALSELRDLDAVEETPYLPDARKCLYELMTDAHTLHNGLGDCGVACTETDPDADAVPTSRNICSPD